MISHTERESVTAGVHDDVTSSIEPEVTLNLSYHAGVVGVTQGCDVKRDVQDDQSKEIRPHVGWFVRKEYNLKCDKTHDLVHTTRAPTFSYEGGFICSLCSNKDQFPNYQCVECEYDVCLSCLTKSA
jgi:hypothetical protein